MVLKILLILLVSAVAVVLMARIAVQLYASPRIRPLSDAPEASAAVVLGAGLLRDGSPTAVLRDRVETAAELYFQGKVRALLFSGDNRFLDYNEPGAMREYALKLGVPDHAIVLDYAGRRTYDTCYRAKHIFMLEDALIVTQKFHLPRAVFTCNQLGLPTIGIDADRRIYRRTSALIWTIRELPATLMAVWESMVTQPLPILGDQEPIFPLKPEGES